MKKIVCSLLVVLMMLGALALVVGAQDTEDVSLPPAQQEADTEDDAALPSTEQIAEDTENVIAPIDYSAIAKQFISYIQSEAAPEELIDSIIAMGDEMSEMKENGYTFKERLLQLVSSENVLKTAAALFMLIGAILFFIIRKKLKNSGYDIEDTLLEARAANATLQKEKEEREKDSKEIKACRAEIAELKGLLEDILSGVKKVGNGSVGVAKMVKDVFLNSRTLDAEGKSLMTRNFLEAIGDLNGGQDEKRDEV